MLCGEEASVKTFVNKTVYVSNPSWCRLIRIPDEAKTRDAAKTRESRGDTLLLLFEVLE